MRNRTFRCASRTALAALLLVTAFAPAMAAGPKDGPLVLWHGEHPLGPHDFTVGPRARQVANPAEAGTATAPTDVALDERHTPLGGGWQATTYGRDIRWAEVGGADATVGAGLGIADAPAPVTGPTATGVAGQARTGLALPLGDGAAATAELSRTYAGGVSELTGDGAGLVVPRTDQVTIGAKLKF